MGFSTFIRRDQRATLLSFHHMKIQQKVCRMQPGRESSWGPDSARTLIWDILLQTHEEQIFFDYKPPDRWYFFTAPWTDCDTL